MEVRNLASILVAIVTCAATAAGLCLATGINRYLFMWDNVAYTAGFSDAIFPFMIAFACAMAAVVAFALMPHPLAAAILGAAIGICSAGLYVTGYTSIVIVLLAGVAAALVVFVLSRQLAYAVVACLVAMALISLGNFALGLNIKTTVKAQSNQPCMTYTDWRSASTQERMSFVTAVAQDAARNLGVEDLTVAWIVMDRDTLARWTGSELLLNRAAAAVQSPTTDRIVAFESLAANEKIAWTYAWLTSPEALVTEALHAVAHCYEEKLLAGQITPCAQWVQAVGDVDAEGPNPGDHSALAEDDTREIQAYYYSYRLLDTYAPGRGKRLVTS